MAVKRRAAGRRGRERVLIRVAEQWVSRNIPIPPATASTLLALSAVAAVTTALPRTADAITIVPTFDVSVTSHPQSANIQNAFNYVALQYKNLYSDPVNINITVVAGSSGLGGSSTSILGTNTYTQMRTALIGDATSANDTVANASLPVASPLPAGSLIAYSRAQAKALNIIPSDAVSDGTFTFNGTFGYSFDPVNHQPAAGQFDFIGVAQHEVTEIMGRIPGLGTNFFGQPDYLPYDMFRWTAPGTRGLTNGGGIYYSLDSGTTNLKGFNNAAAFGGDPQDWDSSTNDAYNAFTSSGVMSLLSPVDVTTNDVIGFNLANLVWSGAADNTTWNIFNTSNWTNSSGNTKFTDAALVVFNDTSPLAATTVNLTQTVRPTSVTVSSATNNFTISGAGSIAGVGTTLTKTGTSTLILATNNTYTGGTTISAGTLQIGNGATVGSITGNVVNNGTLAFNRSDSFAFSGNITGSGALRKSGGGTLTLSGANSYGGGTTVNGGGTLQLGANNAAGTGAVALIGGNLNLATFNQAITNLSFGDGGFTGSGNVTGTGTLTLGGSITFNGNNAFTTPASVISSNVALAAGTHSITNNTFFSSNSRYDLIIQGTISGAGGLSKDGSSAYNVAITHASNTYAGATTVTNGQLFLAATNALPSLTPVTVNGGSLNLNPNINESGVTAGNYSQSIGSLAGTGGSVQFASATLTVGNANTSTSYGGAMAGSNGSITKVGTGTLTLSGVLSYTGTTTVSGGTLALANTSSVATAAANVTAGTLRLTPLTTRVLNVNTATVSPGARLDLTDNKLIVRSGTIGTANPSTHIYNGLSGLIQSAYNFSAWDGSGIMSSMPTAIAGVTTIGIATGTQIRGLGATETDTFAGQQITGASVIAMYTYAGDANLDGTIDGGDYGTIDNFVQVPGAFGYANGDFNYDGVIDGGDYGIIDNNIQAQGAPFPTGGVASVSALTAVPEPGGLAVLVGLPLILRRRTRRPATR